MAIPLSELETMLDNLKRAIASATLMVKHGDTLVQYKTTADMIKARDELIKEIARRNKVRRGPRYVTQRSKGY